MRDQTQANAVVSDINVRVVACRLGELSDVVDEGHGGDEVLEGALLDEFAVFECPIGKRAESLLNLLIGQLLGKFSPSNYSPVELVGLYWHFVDLVWMFIFPLVYLMSARI